MVLAPEKLIALWRCAGMDTAGPVFAGRRPSMSSQRSGVVRSITLVKLTFSLAAVSPAIPASRAILAGLGSQDRFPDPVQQLAEARVA